MKLKPGFNTLTSELRIWYGHDNQKVYKDESCKVEAGRHYYYCILCKALKLE